MPKSGSRDRGGRPAGAGAEEYSRSVDELRRVVRTYSHLFLRAADALLIWDTGGIIRNANEAACVLSGLGKEELIGRRCYDLFPRILKPTLSELLARAPAEDDGTILVEVETTLLNSKLDGRGIPVMLRASAVRLDGAVSIFGIAHDLRDLKELEARLASSRARYQEIVENVNDVIIILDAKGVLQFVNSPGQRALERKAGEMTGIDVRQFMHVDDIPTLGAILKKGSWSGPTQQPTIRLFTASGEEREYAVSATPLPDESGVGSGILGILRDVTGRREIEERLKYAERMRSVGDILSKVTHEVKNPLAAIHASAEFLRRHWEADDSKKQEVVQLIAEEATRLNEIITQFLRIQRIPRPNMIEQEIEPVIGNVVRSVEVMLSQRGGVAIGSDISPVHFAFDADLVKQIVWNLVNNAIDAVSGEEVDGSGRIIVNGKLLKDTGHYEIVVSDDGPGMNAELAERAFDPFFTTKARGTGLGLPLVKMHVEAMGGTVSFETREGEGTTISIRLPLESKGR